MKNNFWNDPHAISWHGGDPWDKVLSGERIHAEEALAAIEQRLAGLGQKMRRYLVEPAAALHDDSQPAQDRQVIARVLVGAADHVREFEERPRLAMRQFLEQLPSRLVADRHDEQIEVRPGSAGYLRGLRGRFHGKTDYSAQIPMQEPACAVGKV